MRLDAFQLFHFQFLKASRLSNTFGGIVKVAENEEE